MAKQKGMRVYVLRNAAFGDSSNDGVSARFHTFVLLGDGVPEIFEPCDGTPALLLKSMEFGNRPRHYFAVPMELDEETGEWHEFKRKGLVGPMSGGNYVNTTDSRLTMCPIQVHDRFETQESYDFLCS